jgi:hypothetical protein
MKKSIILMAVSATVISILAFKPSPGNLKSPPERVSRAGVIANPKCFASDSTRPDTVKVPIYVFDKVDTIQVAILQYLAPNGNVKWCSPGWLILKGKVVQNGKGQLQYVEQPVTIGAMDNKRRQVKTL